MRTWREELAWSAGFFDGEGYVGVSPRRDQRGRDQLRINITQVDRRALDRFRRAVGGPGNVHGPYRYAGRPTYQDRHHFVATDLHQCQAIIAMMWEWLSPVKRDQARTALLAAIFAARTSPGQPRLRPTCKRDHPLSGDNAYMFVQGAKDYVSRRCRRCNREGAALRKSVRRVALAMLSA